MTPTTTTSDGLPASPLLRLPLELRLMIYEYLLFPSTHPTTGSGTSIANLLPDFHTYYSADTNNDPFTLSVRTIDPWLGGQPKSWRRRSTYYVRTGAFLTSSTPTTYRILLSPYTAHLRHTIPSLLSLNHQIHAEATKTFYATYTFSFHTAIEAIVPFLTDLTPLARQSVRTLHFTKKVLPYTKEFDRAEWARACAFLGAGGMQGLRCVHLGVVVGRPATGWEGVGMISSAGFEELVRVRRGGVDLEWVEQVLAIGGLGEVRVEALVERCAVPVSETMAFWVAFSRGVVEGGFVGLRVLCR
ncbi:hypothetical protein P153DRAFT_281670 [Dothidotthia symphoricarpi CBS 119687]|uniref:Uncharacterized protein n=1 Tax=Dothidotthia symphoricarpi CBS 119687 TaxID=1392245 RepID=A0A6A6APQ2_9PLEO|nr:uncharacterized protein P153DRAFT_281670 [Dothidotthia symphoricarpi CBS 119687]KAF2133516.1 hypothetical protein P153DRAFT_281670 [Dothidotthia symphoricarpi CBS 119687]